MKLIKQTAGIRDLRVAIRERERLAKLFPLPTYRVRRTSTLPNRREKIKDRVHVVRVYQVRP